MKQPLVRWIAQFPQGLYLVRKECHCFFQSISSLIIRNRQYTMLLSFEEDI